MARKKVIKLMAAAMAAVLVCGAPALSVIADTAVENVQNNETSSEKTDSDGNAPGQNGETPPEKPDGDGNAPGQNGETPPEKPDGSSGTPGQAPGGSSSSVTYSAAETIASDKEESDKTYTSAESDKSALIVSGADVTETNLTVEKYGSSDGGDNCNFYGQNAAVLAKDGATLTIDNATITSDADGANGVFSYGGNGAKNDTAGDGTTVNISNSTITTKGNGSGGIMTTGGGRTNATNLTVDTSGQSSAAIRTDRGGGTVSVKEGSYTTNGTGSPAVYSTADISIEDAALTSNASEGVVIEGKNTVTLKDSTLVANNTKKNGNATHYDSVFLYQSMSGDSSEGTSVFTMTGGKLISKNGEVFHVSSTDGVINLENVAIINRDAANTLLDVSNDGWSSNGNNATLNATSQTLEGNIIVSNAASDKASAKSSLVMNMTKSSFKGAINNGLSSDDIGTVDLTLDADSVWELTGDSYVTSISGTGSINYNGHTLYIGGTAYTQENPYTADSKDTEKATKKVSFKNTSKTYNASSLKKNAKSFKIIKASDGGKVTVAKYYGSSKKYLSVSSAGKVTVKKGTPKGTYKVKVKVAAKGSYKGTTKTIKVVVR